jgi:hypothetical protein
VVAVSLAHWRVILPTVIDVRNEPSVERKKFVSDFSHLYRPLENSRKTLYVPKADVQGLFYDFYHDFLEQVFKKAHKMPTLFCSGHRECTVDEVMAEIKKADVFGSSDNVNLSSIRNNYYLEHVQIVDFIVYEGFPFGSDTVVHGLSLLVSGWKYGEDSLVVMHMKDIEHAMRKKYPELAELLFICAY